MWPRCSRLSDSGIFRKHLKTKGVTAYQKSDARLRELFTAAEIRAARTHAERLRRETPATLPWQQNPYTNVDELLEAVDIIAEMRMGRVDGEGGVVGK